MFISATIEFLSFEKYDILQAILAVSGNIKSYDLIVRFRPY